MSTKIIMVRHGYSVSNDLKFFTGQMDIELTQTGVEQSKMCGECFGRLLHGGGMLSRYGIDSISAIYSSDLKRAYDTALPIAHALSLEISSDEKLREICAGEWEGIPFERLDVLYPEAYSVWKNDIGNACCVGGESVVDFSDRIVKRVRKIAEAYDGETVVLVTHATPIRVICTLAAGLPISEMKSVGWVSNASVSIFEYDGKFKSVAVGLTEHLGELCTSLPRGV